VCTRSLARLCEWDCWVPPSHIWIDSLFVMSAVGKCSLLVSVTLRLMRWSVLQRCTLFAVMNARWTTSNQKLLMLEPQWIKSTEGAKRLLIPPVYSLRGIRAYDELQIVVTEVGQIKQMVTLSLFGITWLTDPWIWQAHRESFCTSNHSL